VSCARLYQEYKGGFFNDFNISVPAAVSVFPEEVYQAPRSWTERAYPNLVHFNSLAKGGHFAAWEQPQLFQKKSGRASGRCANSRRRALEDGTAWPARRPLIAEADECSRNHDTVAAVSLGWPRSRFCCRPAQCRRAAKSIRLARKTTTQSHPRLVGYGTLVLRMTAIPRQAARSS
jgi:hypothetical protein